MGFYYKRNIIRLKSAANHMLHLSALGQEQS